MYKVYVVRLTRQNLILVGDDLVQVPLKDHRISELVVRSLQTAFNILAERGERLVLGQQYITPSIAGTIIVTEPIAKDGNGQGPCTETHADPSCTYCHCTKK